MVLVADLRGGRQHPSFRGGRPSAAETMSTPGSVQKTDGPARTLQPVLRSEEGIFKMLFHQRRAVAAQHTGNVAMYPLSCNILSRFVLLRST